MPSLFMAIAILIASNYKFVILIKKQRSGNANLLR